LLFLVKIETGCQTVATLPIANKIKIKFYSTLTFLPQGKKINIFLLKSKKKLIFQSSFGIS